MTRILFIDGFSGSAKSRSSFKRSRQCLRSCVKALEAQGIGPIDYEIKVVHMSKLQRYTVGHPAGQEQVLREIDKLDFIVLDGDSSTLPWSPVLDPLATLLRICILARKCVFASGRMANMLSFVLADGIRGKPFVVINGDGLGTPLEALSAFPPEDYSQSGDENCAFLDSDTGDLYFPRGSQWVRQGSVGNTYGAGAPRKERSGTIKSQNRSRKSKSVVGEKTFTPFIGRPDETFGSPRPECKSHALFRQLPPGPFLCQRRQGVTVADPRTIRFCKYRSRPLAADQTNNSPLVFEYQNVVGCAFQLSNKYPTSALLLTNYLVDKMKQVVAEGHIDRRLHNTAIGMEAAAASVNAATRRAAQERAQKQAAADREAQSSDNEGARRDDDESGVAASASAVQAKPPIAPPSRNARHHKWAAANSNINQTMRPYVTRIARNHEFINRAADQFEEEAQKTFRDTTQRTRNSGANTTQGSSRSRHTRSSSETDFSSFDLEQKTSTNTKSRKQRHVSRPGSASSTRSDRTLNSSGQTVIRKKQQKRAPSKSYLKWRRIDKQRGGATGFFSVVQGSPYESVFEKERREAAESKVHWISSAPFKTFTGKRTSFDDDDKVKSIHVGAPYNPPGTHQFRPHRPDKSKFAGKQDWRFV